MKTSVNMSENHINFNYIKNNPGIYKTNVLPNSLVVTGYGNALMVISRDGTDVSFYNYEELEWSTYSFERAIGTTITIKE